jgi:glycosyltransferase involved in cell wall biosynthesis
MTAPEPPPTGGPTISIITPCYNGARFLNATLRSALAQSRPPLEVLVVDDGSTDDSASIAESFGPPVRVIRQSNQGESAARNHALAEARGTHVLFLDADDLLEPEALERLSEALKGRPRAVAVMGCAWFAEDPRAPYQVKQPETSRYYPSIIESNLAPPHCWLAPLDVVREAGGFAVDLRWFEDWDLWWRVGLIASELVPVSYVGALYRRHPGSQLATTKLADQARGHAALMTRMVDTLLGRPDILEAHGEQLFWSAVTAYKRARQQDVPVDELSPLATAIGRLASQGSPRVRRLGLARLTRLLGVRRAGPVYDWLAGRGA